MNPAHRPHFLSAVATVATVALLAAVAPAGAQTAQGQFGRQVEIAGDQVIVLKPDADRGASAAYVFERSEDGWVEVQRLGDEVTSLTGERIGPGLDVEGNLALIGSADSDHRLAAHAYERQADGRWTAIEPVPMNPDAAEQEAQPRQLDVEGLFRILSPPRRMVATDGERALVASLEQSGVGDVKLMERDEASGEWTLVGELVPEDGDTSGGYGGALLLTPDRAFVGAPRQSGGSGVVYVYEAGDDGWTETARIDGDVVGEARRLGTALGLHGDVLLIGAPGAGDDAGSVRMLRRADDGTWEQVDEIGAPGQPEARARDGFGSSVASDGTHLFVGAAGASAIHTFARATGAGPGWTPIGGPGGVELGGLGAAVAAAPDLVAAGAPGADGGVGRVAIWERDGSDWTASVLEPAGGLETIVNGEVRCAEGDAAGFPCRDVDLLSFLTVVSLGGEPGERVSDIWGWTDPETGVEYGLVGRSGGMVIVNLSDPADPGVVGVVPANPSGARDIKTYSDHAFFTGDGAGQHGLVVFDLTRLRGVEAAAMPVAFEPDAVYDGVDSAHNLAIDEESGFAYVVRPSGGGETCGGGLHMVDIRTPTEPTFAGCFTDTEGVLSAGSSHDTQCVVYQGPDDDYRGRQMCFASNEGVLRIVDVTDKANPVPIAAASYPAQAYIHQGWLTEDHAYFYLDDELDELVGTTEQTRTLVWDLTDLDDPTYAGELLGQDGASDHNLYIKGDRMYQANYQAGMRVVDISDRDAPVEIGYFDTTPYGPNPPGFNGAWTAYPYFDSGTVIVSSMNEGLFVLRPVRPLVP